MYLLTIKVFFFFLQMRCSCGFYSIHRYTILTYLLDIHFALYKILYNLERFEFSKSLHQVVGYIIFFSPFEFLNSLTGTPPRYYRLLSPRGLLALHTELVLIVRETSLVNIVETLRCGERSNRRVSRQADGYQMQFKNNPL